MTQRWVYGIIWVLVPIMTLVLGITIGVPVIVWLEREISAGVQQCIGPEYSGLLGVLQALADGTKLLFKENLLPSRGDTQLFIIGASIAVIAILLSYSVIPSDYHLVLANLNIGVFLWIAVSSIAPIGLLILIFANKWYVVFTNLGVFPKTILIIKLCLEQRNMLIFYKCLMCTLYGNVD